MRTWLLRVYGDLAAGRIGPTDHPAARAAVDAVHVLVVLARETVRDRLHVRAAHLAYWTAVAIVPILMLGFALTGPLGLADSSRESVRQLLYDTILAGSVEEVGGLLDDLIEHTHLGTLGTIGVLSTMFVGSQLFFNAELAYNDIFRARVERSWILRFTLFYAVITLGPVLLASGFILSARLGADGRVFPLFSRLLPLLISAPMFVTALRLLPCARVSWRAALTGGLVTALLFEGAKLGFGVYLDVFGTRDSLAVIYGSVAFLPVFLLWTYVLWLVVLFGVEVAWLVQHHGSLLDAQRRLAVDPHAATRTADAFFALAVMRAVGDHFQSGRGPASGAALAEASGLDPRHVQEALDVLISEGLLVLVDGARVLPCRPPDELPPSEVLAAWRRRTAPPLLGPAAEAVDAALAAVDASMRPPHPPARPRAG
jgi:membrane protein